MGLYESYLGSIFRDGCHIAIRTSVVTISGGVSVPLPAEPLEKRKMLAIKNISGGIIWVGASGVDSVSGWPIADGAAESYPVSDRVVLYGYASTTVSGVYVMELA